VRNNKLVLFYVINFYVSFIHIIRIFFRSLYRVASPTLGRETEFMRG